MGIDEINGLLADVAEELRSRWEEMPEASREVDIGVWVAQTMPRVGALLDSRREASQSQLVTGIDDLGDRLGWRDVEKQHALDCIREDADYAGSYGDECVITTHSGRELRSPAFPAACDYLRVTQQGFELGYWSADEWAQDPEVIGSIMGCLKGDAEAPEAEDFTYTFDLRPGHERQGGLL